MRIVVGIIGIVIGYLMLRYSDKIRNFSGTWQWAEKAFGQGTYTGIKVVGIAVAFLSFVYMTGTMDKFIEITIGGLVQRP